MRVGIFGGSFNPPHKMHFEMGLELLNKNYIDKIIYVPTGSKYKYKHNLVDGYHRLNMLKLMVSNDCRFIVSDYELKDEVVYTYQTLDHFKKIYPSDEIYFICGADNLSYIDKWQRGFDILKNYKILVIKRCGENVSELLEKFKEYKSNIIITDISPNELSSTFIRNKIKHCEKVEEYLNDDVLKYIRENCLYEA